jgi:DNA polymerase-3 subunit beta
MKHSIIVNRKDLLEYLKINQKLFKRNTTLPICENILFKWNGKIVELISGDLEQYVITTIPSLSDSSGSICFEGKLIRDFLMKDKAINTLIEIDTESFTIRFNDNIQIVGIDGDEFPSLPEFKEDFSVDLSGLFQWELQNQKPFQSNDDLRPVMTGTFFGNRDGKVQIATTDAHTLRVLTLSDSQEKESWGLILSKNTVNCILAVIDETKHGLAPLNIQFNEARCVLTIGEYKVLGRNIEGKFPNYNAVIPEKNEVKVQMKRNQLIDAINKVAITSNQSTRQIELHFKDNKVNITASNYDLDISMKETFNCNLILPEGMDNFKIGFNYKMLLRCLNAYKDDLILLEFSEDSRPAIIQDNFITTLCMPVMINN